MRGEGDHAEHGGGGEIRRGGLDVERMRPPPPPRGGGGLNEAVLAAARGWLGTPYRHQASVKGAGADCLGLVRGVWREVAGEEPETPPPYRADWAEVGGEETLLHAARRWLVEIRPEAVRPGDVLLFRMGLYGGHVGIASVHPAWGVPACLHAYAPRRQVVEQPMDAELRAALLGAFRLPALAAAAEP